VIEHHEAKHDTAEAHDGGHEFRHLLSGEDSEHGLPCAHQERFDNRAEKASNHSRLSRQVSRGSTAASLIMPRQLAEYACRFPPSKKSSLFSTAVADHTRQRDLTKNAIIKARAYVMTRK
jgi:hypothetical protein